MADDHQHLKEAIAEFEIGNKVIARQILMEALVNDPDDKQAWLLLAEYAESTEQKTEALLRAMAINSQNQSVQDTLKQPEVESNPVAGGKAEQELAAAFKTGPGLAKKSYNIIESVEELPLTVHDKKQAEFKFPRRSKGKWFWASIGLLAGVIVLWAVFFILLINGQGLNLFGAVRDKAERTIAVTAISSSTPQPTQAAPENTAVPTPLPAATITAAPTSFPTLDQTTAAQLPEGSSGKPVQVGSSYRFDGYGKMTVTGFSWIAGRKGMAVANLAFECERPAEEICATEMYTFALVGSSGAAYPSENDPSVPQPWFGSITNLPTYGGKTELGNVGFVVPNPESGMLVKVGFALEPGDEVYFALP